MTIVFSLIVVAVTDLLMYESWRKWLPAETLTALSNRQRDWRTKPAAAPPTIAAVSGRRRGTIDGLFIKFSSRGKFDEGFPKRAHSSSEAGELMRLKQ